VRAKNRQLFFSVVEHSRRRDRPLFSFDLDLFLPLLSRSSSPTSSSSSLSQPKQPKLSIGKDATEDFEEIGHSAAANEMLAKYKIGALKGGDGGKAARKQAASAVSTGAGGGSSGVMRALQVLLPLLAVLAALLLPKLLAK
jgi:hypothetical protein